MKSRHDAIEGCLLGTAVGDAVGLPCEGLSRRRQRALFGVIERPNLFVGRGMVSDDTEHTCLVAQALIASAGDVKRFEQVLSRQLRLWSATLPAGAGLATLKACVRLWFLGPNRSGVFSAGNGPAMRAALLGACHGDDAPRLRELVRASTCLTHTDPKAEAGAFAVALAGHYAALHHPDETFDATKYVDALRAGGGCSAELLELIESAVQSTLRGESTPDFAARMGWEHGVSGYIYR